MRFPTARGFLSQYELLQLIHHLQGATAPLGSRLRGSDEVEGTVVVAVKVEVEVEVKVKVKVMVEVEVEVEVGA